MLWYTHGKELAHSWGGKTHIDVRRSRRATRLARVGEAIGIMPHTAASGREGVARRGQARRPRCHGATAA